MKKIISYSLLFLLSFMVFSCSSHKVNKNKVNKNKNFKLSEKEQLSALISYFIEKNFDIPKPIYPKKPKKPKVKQAENITKGKFEKTISFRKRIKKATLKRERYILKLENAYKKKILAYNKKVKNLNDEYSNKIKSLNHKIDTLTLRATKKAYGIVYGKPMLISRDYDADNEVFYGEIRTSKGNYNKKVAIKLNPNEAKSFYDEKNKTPKLVYGVEKGNIFLKKIQIPFKKNIYTAMISDNEYKSNAISMAINTREINLKKDLIESNFKMSKKSYNIGAIKYGKSKVARLDSKDLAALNKQLLNRLNDSQENLSTLLKKAKKRKTNNKKYAVIFGIEDYLLESDVGYSQNSALMFMQYANKLLGVPDDNIWAFIGNRKTTAGFIKSQWKDFLSLVDDGATIYFYYSGHGVPDSKGNAFMLPSDTNAETIETDKTFMLKNIYADLSKSKAKKVLAFVDSCFSGKDDKGELLFDGVAPILKSKKTTFNKNKMTIFTAGGKNNFSNQYKEKEHRLFSYFLMKGIAQEKRDINKLFKYVRTNVANKSRKLGVAYKQIPELMGKKRGQI